ncbi:hypothetical protein Trco_003447 [Trichoderma cornu-damae]|uniref:Uncharacterized protein n=1 Tax=Trichoderma cornu-damae TaxID=654480 RepID=A0A9P8TXA6_9HYPO|nr:hypothetical protein Trco_003447 [Trichoderma cornu-damae]
MTKSLAAEPLLCLDEPDMKDGCASGIRKPATRTALDDVDGDWPTAPSHDPEPAATVSSSGTEGNEKAQCRPSMNFDVDPGAASSSSTWTATLPIAIPRSRHNSSASTIAFHEALSARGEMQGAYFPFHEDPKTRIRHLHPFYHGLPYLESLDTGAGADVEMPTHEPQYDLSNSTKEGYGLLSDSDGDGPCDGDSDSSSDYYDEDDPFNALLLGKYYPSVYEKRQAKESSLQSVAPSASASATATATATATMSETAYETASAPASSNGPPVGRSMAPRTQRRRLIRPRTPVISPRLPAATEYIPPLELESEE